MTEKNNGIPCEIEEAYRRCFSQGSAFATYAVRDGATAGDPEAWRLAVYEWRIALPLGSERVPFGPVPPVPTIGGLPRD